MGLKTLFEIFVRCWSHEAPVSSMQTGTCFRRLWTVLKHEYEFSTAHWSTLISSIYYIWFLDVLIKVLVAVRRRPTRSDPLSFGHFVL